MSDGELEMIPVKEPPIEVRMEVKLLTTGEPSSWVLQRFLAHKYHRFATFWDET